MLMCDLAKAMQLLWGLIMQNSLLTLVVQYGTELRGQRLLQKSTNPGHPISASLFLVPAHIILLPCFWGVRGSLACTGCWVKMRTHTYSSLLGWRLPWGSFLTDRSHWDYWTQPSLHSPSHSPSLYFDRIPISTLVLQPSSKGLRQFPRQRFCNERHG